MNDNNYVIEPDSKPVSAEYDPDTGIFTAPQDGWYSFGGGLPVWIEKGESKPE